MSGIGPGGPDSSPVKRPQARYTSPLEITTARFATPRNLFTKVLVSISVIARSRCSGAPVEIEDLIDLLTDIEVHTSGQFALPAELRIRHAVVEKRSQVTTTRPTLSHQVTGTKKCRVNQPVITTLAAIPIASPINAVAVRPAANRQKYLSFGNYCAPLLCHGLRRVELDTGSRWTGLQPALRSGALWRNPCLTGIKDRLLPHASHFRVRDSQAQKLSAD